MLHKGHFVRGYLAEDGTLPQLFAFFIERCRAMATRSALGAGEAVSGLITRCWGGLGTRAYPTTLERPFVFCSGHRFPKAWLLR